MFLGFLDFLVCFRLINFLKEISQIQHFLQFSYIFLCFLNGCLRWLIGVGGGCEDTELTPKLEADILQSSNELVDFFCKDRDMSAILIFAVASLIVTDRGGSLVVFYTCHCSDGVRLVFVMVVARVRGQD
jgi:hypothetical protein